MQKQTHSLLQVRFIRVPATSMAVFLLLLVTFLAVDDHAHEALHEEGHLPDHTCVVSLVAQGHLTGFAAPIAVEEAPALFCHVVPHPAVPTIPARPHLLPPSCGPPAAV